MHQLIINKFSNIIATKTTDQCTLLVSKQIFQEEYLFIGQILEINCMDSVAIILLNLLIIKY